MPERRNVLKKMQDVVLRNQNIKVRADDDRADELGTINFYGNVTKRRAETTKFHERWMVLRGLDLYWYRRVNDPSQKGIMQLPAKPVVEEIVDDKKCFAL